MSTNQITRAQIDAILKEAKSADIGPAGTNKAASAPAAVSISGLKTQWPKVRSAVLFVISILQMFHRGDMAAGLAQFAALMDLLVGGALPTS